MTRTPFLFSGLLLAACAAHTSSPPPVNSGGGGEHALPREYAALFAPGTVWSFTTDQTIEGDTTEKTSGVASCRVVQAQRGAAGFESQIECTDLQGNQGSDPVSGNWLATDDGLYFLGVGDFAPDVEKELGNAVRVLDATPRARHEEGKDPDEEDYSWSNDVKQDGGAWCYTRTDDGGDSSWSSVCIDEAGVKSGDFGWSGGSTYDTMFTRK